MLAGVLLCMVTIIIVAILWLNCGHMVALLRPDCGLDVALYKTILYHCNLLWPYPGGIVGDLWPYGGLTLVVS